MSAINGKSLAFFSLCCHLLLMMLFGSSLSPLSVIMVMFTVMRVISPVIVNAYTNGCYNASRQHCKLNLQALNMQKIQQQIPILQQQLEGQIW